MSATEEQAEVGFELKGQFYRWSVSDAAKDLMLIDRFTQMPAHQFFELIEDNFDRGRGPILLAMMACSIRRAHPDWSVERVTRTVLDLTLTEVTFIGGDDDEEVEVPNQEEKAPSDAPGNTPKKKSSGSPESQTSEKLPETQE